MFLGRVIGRVWATAKNQALESHRLLIVQPVNTELQATGKTLICLDSVGAGAGEIVYWCRGRECSFPFLPSEVPSDATIVGIVDEISVGGKTTPC
jgi:microcompartment protein CcmK/EutM